MLDSQNMLNGGSATRAPRAWAAMPSYICLSHSISSFPSVYCSCTPSLAAMALKISKSLRASNWGGTHWCMGNT
ncbi:hypothetical protein D3C75_633410 [compost metagenome]